MPDLAEQIRIWLDSDPPDPQAPADAAIGAVFDLHRPSIIRARPGIRADLHGDGCAHCGRSDLIRDYEVAGQRWHDHVDLNPTCDTCHSTEDYEAYADWPCLTVQAIAAALGVDQAHAADAEPACACLPGAPHHQHGRGGYAELSRPAALGDIEVTCHE